MTLDSGERATLARVYELLMHERDRVDKTLGEFREEISGFRAEQQTMARQVAEIHTMVAGFPCTHHTEEISELQRGQKAPGGYQVTVNLADAGKLLKVVGAAAAALGVVWAALRDQLATILAGGKGP